MKTIISILIAAAFIFLGFLFIPEKTSDRYLGGIMVNEPDHQHWVETLKEEGFNTTAVTVYAKQGDWDTDKIWWEDNEPSVVKEIVTAKQNGIKVALVLRVALDHAWTRNEFFWHGMIMPETDEQLDSWFKQYGKFINKWAVLADSLNVDLLAVGSELNALSATQPLDKVPGLYTYYLDSIKQQKLIAKTMRYEQLLDKRKLWVNSSTPRSSLYEQQIARESANRYWANLLTYDNKRKSLDRMNKRRAKLDSNWRALIGNTRAVYKGQLSYAANFDNYKDVGFWDALDVMGVNAYFQLRPLELEKSDKLPAIVGKSWESEIKNIQKFQKKQSLDLPFLFTELGLTNRQLSTVRPWEGFGYSIIEEFDDTLIVWQDQPVNLDERAMAIEQLATVADTIDQFAGFLYWKLTTNPNHQNLEPFAVVIGEKGNDPAVPFMVDMD